MRRRLFWQVAILDLRSAEDQGTDLTLVDRAFDTQLPLNINDSDISPESRELPRPRIGPTDMTFSLIRYEICSLARRLHTASSAMANGCPNDASRTLEERETMLAETYHRVEHTYLKDTTIEDNPIYWVAANIARVIVAKMTLVIYQPLLFPGPSSEALPADTRDRLFRAAIDVLEYNHLLNTDPRSQPWRWLFKTYTQWHAVAYVLLEISPPTLECQRREGVDRPQFRLLDPQASRDREDGRSHSRVAAVQEAVPESQEASGVGDCASAIRPRRGAEA